MLQLIAKVVAVGSLDKLSGLIDDSVSKIIGFVAVAPHLVTGRSLVVDALWVLIGMFAKSHKFEANVVTSALITVSQLLYICTDSTILHDACQVLANIVDQTHYSQLPIDTVPALLKIIK